jgi:hypothetical protein
MDPDDSLDFEESSFTLKNENYFEDNKKSCLFSKKVENKISSKP